MTDDPSLRASLALIVEKSINTALKHDPATRGKLAALAGRSIEVDTRAPNFTLFIAIDPDEIRVLSHCETEADVKLQGETSEFLSLIGKDTHSLADTHISISGKVSVLNQIKNALSDLDIDWEDMLADIFGVIPAHLFANFGREVFTWAKQQKSHFETHLPQYLSEELKAVPTAAELNIFYDAVDEIKSSTQRFEAKLRQLKHALNTPTNSKTP